MTLSEQINQHMTINEEIDRIIADNGGRARDAVNILLERVKQRDQTIKRLEALIEEAENQISSLCEQLENKSSTIKQNNK